MDDFTKIKLINSLIDVVEHFYSLKQKDKDSEQKHLKGFSEGLAFGLTQMQIIDSDEAKRILQGLGKKRELLEPKVDKVVSNEIEDFDPNDLEVPTVFRKKKEMPLTPN